MEFDSKIYISILFLLVFSVYFAFSGPAIAEAGYKELLSLKIGSQYLDFVKLAIPLLAFASSALLFRTAAPDSFRVPFIVSILFILSPIMFSNISYAHSLVTAAVIFLASASCFLFFRYQGQAARGAAIILLVISAYLAYTYPDSSFSLAKIKDAGLLLPLSALSFALIIKDRINASVVLFILGAAVLLFLPSIALVFLAFAALHALDILSKEFDNMLFWAVFVLFLTFYLFFNPTAGNLLNAIGVSLAFSLISYFLLPLFKLSNAITPFSVFLVVLGFANGIFLLNQADFGIPAWEELEVFSYAASLPAGTFGVLDHQHSFEYYTQKKPLLLNADDMLENRSLGIDYAVLSAGGLEKAMGPRPVFFRLFSVSADNGRYSADFVNRNYLLRIALSQDSSIIDDAVLFDLSKNGQGRTVSFPKLKPFNSNTNLLEGGAIINTESILDTNLYNLLFVNPVLYEAKGIKLARARG